MASERRKLNAMIILLLVVFSASLAVRVWLLDKRWINPDEGAHLMDAVLALDGMIPSVDFHSRQPLYVYANAAILKLLGINYVSGRLLPLICSMLVAWPVFWMARMFFDEKVAILSATIYWMLPLELINSPIVKTEPLVILITCMCMCALVLFSQNSRPQWLVLTGIFAAMGFYVRQSALIVPVTVFGFLVLFHGGQIREITKSFGYFLVGYTSVLVLVVLYYSRFMRIDEVLMSGLTPLGFLIPQGKKLLVLFGLSVETVNRSSPQASSLPYDKYPLYYKYVREAFRLHSFLLIGLVFSLMTLCLQILSRNKDRVKEHIMSHSILYLWLFSLSVAYTYFFYTQGFYIDYFREFLPPLVIIFSAWLRYSLPSFDNDDMLGYLIIGGLCLYAIFGFAESYFKLSLGAGFYLSLAIALYTLFKFQGSFESSTRRLAFLSILSLLIIVIFFSKSALFRPYFSGMLPRLAVIGIVLVLPLAFVRNDVSPKLQEYAIFLSLSLVLGAFVLSLSHSTLRLGLAYDSVWSPQSLEKTTSYLNTHTRSHHKVLSGAVIWELQSLRRPFLNISHPLGFQLGVAESEKKRLQSAILTQPPGVIILDGYTEKTYFRIMPWLTDFVNSKYQLVFTTGPARYPIRVFQLKTILQDNFTSYPQHYQIS